MNENDGWAKVGDWVATAFNNAIRNIDTDQMAEAISGFVSGVLEMAYTFFEHTNWKEVGDKIAGVLCGIDWWDILTKLIRFIFDVWVALETMRQTILWNIAFALYKWLRERKEEIINKITQAMKDFLDCISKNGENITTNLSGIWDKVKIWWGENVKPKLTLKYWQEKLSPMADAIKQTFKDTFNGVIEIVETAINYMIKKLNTLQWDIPDWVPRNRWQEVWV